MPSALSHPRSHGVHPWGMLDALAVRWGAEWSARCPAAPSYISLILPKCSGRHSHSSSPHCEHTALNHAAPNSCSRKPMAWEAASRAQQALPPWSMSEELACLPRPAPTLLWREAACAGASGPAWGAGGGKQRGCMCAVFLLLPCAGARAQPHPRQCPLPCRVHGNNTRSTVHERLPFLRLPRIPPF